MMWLLFAIFSGLGAAILAIMIKIGLKNVDSILLAFAFSLVMTITFLILGFVLKKFDVQVLINFTKKEWLYLALASLVNALAFISYFTALQCGKACNVVAIDRLSIVFILILSMIILKESFTVTSILGAACMVIGAWLLVLG